MYTHIHVEGNVCMCMAYSIIMKFLTIWTFMTNLKFSNGQGEPLFLPRRSWFFTSLRWDCLQQAASSQQVRIWSTWTMASLKLIQRRLRVAPRARGREFRVGVPACLDWGLQNKSRACLGLQATSLGPARHLHVVQRRGLCYTTEYLQCAYTRTLCPGAVESEPTFHWFVWGVPKGRRVDTGVDIARKVYGPQSGGGNPQ